MSYNYHHHYKIDYHCHCVCHHRCLARSSLRGLSTSGLRRKSLNRPLSLFDAHHHCGEPPPQTCHTGHQTAITIENDKGYAGVLNGKEKDYEEDSDETSWESK